MTKSDELRDMSDEQLGLTLKEAAEKLVPPADSSRRPSGSTRRAKLRTQSPARSPASRPFRTQRKPRKQPRAATAEATCEPRRVTSHAQTTSHRRRHRATRCPRPVAWRFRAWSGTRSTARSCVARRSATCTTRTTSRTMGDTVEIIEAPPTLAAEALGAGADRHQEPAGGHRRHAGRRPSCRKHAAAEATKSKRQLHSECQRLQSYGSYSQQVE